MDEISKRRIDLPCPEWRKGIQKDYDLHAKMESREVGDTSGEIIHKIITELMAHSRVERGDSNQSFRERHETRKWDRSEEQHSETRKYNESEQQHHKRIQSGKTETSIPERDGFLPEVLKALKLVFLVQVSIEIYKEYGERDGNWAVDVLNLLRVRRVYMGKPMSRYLENPKTKRDGSNWERSWSL